MMLFQWSCAKPGPPKHQSVWTLNYWLRDDLGPTNLSVGYFSLPLTEEIKLTCGGRTISMDKVPDNEDYIAHYEGSRQGYRGRIPYMVLSMFENAPGVKTAFAAAPICGHYRGPQLVVIRSLQKQNPLKKRENLALFSLQLVAGNG
jgi:hypothetical protein